MPPADRLAVLYETFAPADIDRLDQHYTADASFRDPFSDVRGLEAIRAVYRHMFEALHEPRFRIVDKAAGDGGGVMLVWDFSFGLRRRGDVQRCTIRGASHLVLAGDGRIARHRDFWDTAELYERFPGLGVLMRWLRRRAGPRWPP